MVLDTIIVKTLIIMKIKKFGILGWPREFVAHLHLVVVK